MAMKYSKKGIAFSFLVIFLVIVLFAFLNLKMSNNQFTKDSVFIDSRINYVSEELFYFKNIYLQNVVSYSFYNTIDSLINFYGSSSNYSKLNQNYSLLNDLIFEGMINGTFEGILQSNLIGEKNKTISYFFDEFIKDFDTNYKANLTLDVININVYEKTPYYLSIQLLINISVTTNDNISSWNSIDNYFVNVPITDLPAPDFLLYEDETIPTKSVEYNLASQEWSLENFQETINQSYSVLFFEDKHKYHVGNSYLKRLLNISYGSYKDVLGFWSFDYDDEEELIYDSSLNNDYGFDYGNSIGLYDFNNETILSGVVSDLSSYQNDGSLNGDVNCSFKGIYENGCYFDGVGDDITINDFSLINNQISVFSWIYINNTVSGNNLSIVCAEDEYFCYWLNLDSNSISVKLNNAVKIAADSFINFNNINISRNSWHNVGFTYDGNYTYLYLDGIKYGSEYESDGTDLYSGSLNGVVGDLTIGEDFKGLIDEVGIYSRVLTRDEISTLYNNKKVLFADYKDTFHGKGIYFDGIDDYINLGDNDIYNFNNDLGSIEIWFKIANLSGESVLVNKGESGVDGWGIRISNGKIIIGGYGSGLVQSDLEVINKTDYWYYLVVSGFDNNNLNIFLNNQNVDYSIISSIPGSDFTNYNLTIGKASDSDSNYFKGIIDEIKIYNTSLTRNQIENNYLDYDSFGKGCCNYLLLINPTKFNYDSSSYKNNVSYSSKIFYDYYVRGIEYNISLYNLTNVTTFDTSKNYYNFLFDDCIQSAFSVSDYQTNDSSIDMSLYKLEGVDNASCSNLVSLGVY